ncbi:MAG: type II secretion system F family protein [Acidobacteria bacterium]|nr:type II secretion system F family protein [Acidobacteriota bacterium]
MPEFLVKVADERGHVTEQLENAHSEAEARDRYSSQGMLVYSVRPRGVLSTSGGGFRLRRKLKLEQFVIFNEQFITLVKAGLPIVTALDLLIRRQKKGMFRSLLEDVHGRVKAGESLSDSFTHHAVVPRLYTTTLLAGEKSGNLEEVLRRYINFQRLALTFRKKLTASMIYPTILIVMVIVMLTFLVTYVVPQFASLYTQLNAQLPPMTVFMLDVGTTIRKFFWLIVALLAGGLFLFWRAMRTETGAHRLDRIRLATPLLGGIWLKYQVAVFSRMLATLLSGGLPLVNALDTAGASMQSRSIKTAVTAAEQRVREGQPLARSLEATRTFPELSVEMIEVGESTGALPAMLTSVAEFFEEDVQTATTAAMSLIEPLILVFMGVVVVVVLLSLYLPIFSLGANIH